MTTMAQLLGAMRRLGLRRCGKCWEWRKAGVLSRVAPKVVGYGVNARTWRIPDSYKMPSKVAPWVCEECRDA